LRLRLVAQVGRNQCIVGHNESGAAVRPIVIVPPVAVDGAAVGCGAGAAVGASAAVGCAGAAAVVGYAGAAAVVGAAGAVGTVVSGAPPPQAARRVASTISGVIALISLNRGI